MASPNSTLLVLFFLPGVFAMDSDSLELSLVPLFSFVAAAAVVSALGLAALRAADSEDEKPPEYASSSDERMHQSSCRDHPQSSACRHPLVLFDPSAPLDRRAYLYLLGV